MAKIKVNYYYGYVNIYGVFHQLGGPYTAEYIAKLAIKLHYDAYLEEKNLRSYEP
jgi:hypothetical protein